MFSKEKLQKALFPITTPIEVPKHIEVVCGVLIPLGLVDSNQSIEVIMTKRTSTVMTHKGQISFPGGVKELEDMSILETALRESFEEVGLKSEHVEILGRLPEVTTHTTNLLIYPFVGMMQLPYDFHLNEDEVDRIIHIPLEKILKEGLPERTVEISGFRLKSIGFEHDGELIWGASARMLEDLRKIITSI